LKLGNPFQCFGWRELNDVLEADTAECLNELVKEVQPWLRITKIIKRYTFIPLVYILSSLGSSIMYLYAFRLVKNDVLHSPMGGVSLVGNVKSIWIVLSFIGFIFFDLLYTQIIMRYAYRCQLNIYYLQIIKGDIDNYKNMNKDQAKENFQKEIMGKVGKADTFIKQLNASSITTGFVILIAGFTATNCAIDLLCTEITYFQATVVSLRLILWTFLALFPFHKAATVNIASKELHNTGLIMCRRPVVFKDFSHKSINYHGAYFTLKAKLFGISVRSWLSYVIIILLLLSIMIGSKFKWYEHLL